MGTGINVVTGATGLLGRHLVSHLLERGERVRAVVRPGRNNRSLHERGVETVDADLADAAALKRAVTGAGIVYHTAAKVGDWGPWPEFQTCTVEGTRNVLTACQESGVGRVLYVSSISVYGRHDGADLLTEDSPLAPVESQQKWDYYGRSKILAEAIAREFGPMVTIVRPSWCYGPGDRTGLPRLVHNLRKGRAKLVGDGSNVLNLVHAADVAAGCALAANHPAAAGRSYNLTSAGEVTQKQLMDLLCDELQVPRLTKRVSYRLAMRGALFVEIIGRLIQKKDPPRYTRRVIYVMGRTTRYSTERAKAELGWRPRRGIEEGIREALEWFLKGKRATCPI